MTTTHTNPNTHPIRKRNRYGAEGTIVSYRDPKNPLTIVAAREILHRVESSREWVPVKNPNELRVRGHMLFAGSKVLGEIPAHGAGPDAVRYFSQVHVTKDVERRVNAGFKNRNFKYDELRVRRTKESHTILGITTDRYSHIPYDTLLDGFPKSYIVPRLQIDSRFVQIHVTEPQPIMKGVGDVFIGARIISSDTRQARAMLMDEIMRLVCTNGLIRAELEIFFKRYHMDAEDNKVMLPEEWRAKVAAFLTHTKSARIIEAKRITHARSAKTTPEKAGTELAKLGLGKSRIESAIDYAKREFGVPLSRWAIAQGVTHASQFQRGVLALPTSIRIGNDTDAIAALYLDPTKRANIAAAA